MLNDLGVSVMAAGAHRHCLAAETQHTTTAEGGVGAGLLMKTSSRATVCRLLVSTGDTLYTQ